MNKDQPVDREAFLARVLARREELRLSEQRVCRDAGLSTSALKNIRSRPDQVPTLKVVVPIARVLGLNPEWLAFGRGDKFAPGEETVVIPFERADDNEGHSSAVGYSEEDARVSGLRGNVPEIDASAGAGNGSLGNVIQLETKGIASGHAVKFEWNIPPELMRYHFGVTPGRVVILPVKGDSMSPTLSDGDRVLVDLDDHLPNDGGIFLLDDGHGPIVKRARLVSEESGEVIEIISDNPMLSPVKRPVDEVRVIGRVRGRWSRL